MVKYFVGCNAIGQAITRVSALGRASGVSVFGIKKELSTFVYFSGKSVLSEDVVLQNKLLNGENWYKLVAFVLAAMSYRNYLVPQFNYLFSLFFFFPFYFRFHLSCLLLEVLASKVANLADDRKVMPLLCWILYFILF